MSDQNPIAPPLDLDVLLTHQCPTDAVEYNGIACSLFKIELHCLDFDVYAVTESKPVYDKDNEEVLVEAAHYRVLHYDIHDA